MPYRRFSRFPRRRIYRRKNLGKKKISRNVKKYVKKAIRKGIQNKEQITYAGNNTLYTISAANLNTANYIPLLPTPVQGSGEHQKVGNSIRLVSGIIKGHVSLLPVNVSYNPLVAPVYCKMWLIKDLADQHTVPFSIGGATFLDQFFRGNGTTLGFQANMLDIDLPVDDMHYRVCRTKTFKLGASAGSTETAAGTYFDNGPMVVPFQFNYSRFARKLLKYSESNPQGAANCINDNLSLVIQVVYADGTTGGGYRPARIDWVNHMKYENA